MDVLETFLAVAMAIVLVAVPLSITLILGALLRATSGAGLATWEVAVPPDARSRAERTFARVRAHRRRIAAATSAAPVPFLRALAPTGAPEQASDAGRRARAA